MIFRAIFWIGVVSLLTPHEPDLGLGRPGAGALLPSPAAVLSASGLSRTGTACDNQACAGAPSSIASSVANFLGKAVASAPTSTASHARNLDDVRDEIEAELKARHDAKHV